MYKLVFFVPEQALDAVKAACFDAGAGKIGDYDRCCWQILGEGQFRPLAGSNPYIGSAPESQAKAGLLAMPLAGVLEAPAAGLLEKIAEYRVELVCTDEAIRPAVKAMKLAHPYEEPAYDVWRLEVF